MVAGCVVISFAFFVGLWYRKRCIAFRRIWATPTNVRIAQLDNMLEKSGLGYARNQDVFTANCHYERYPVYDEKQMRKSARKNSYVIDTLPLYFCYAGKEWMVWLCKGQFGICSGVEVVVFVKEGIGYHVVSERTPFEIGVVAYENGKRYLSYSVVGSRLLCYEMGCVRAVDEIRLRTRIIFPNTQMMQAFVEEGLQVHNTMFQVEHNCNWITLDYAKQPIEKRSEKYIRWMRMKKNRYRTFLYCVMTRPFRNNLNRSLFMYFQFPRWMKRRLCLKHL